MDCEMKDECGNYNGECTGDDYCLCEDFVEIDEEQKLWNTLSETIDKMRERNQEDLIQRCEQYEKREEELYERIAELKRQIPNVDQLREECLQEVRREVFGNFLPGQKVFIKCSKSEQIPCSYCNGSGKITITHANNSENINCTKCHGRKTEYRYIPSIEQKRIERIELWIVEYEYNKLKTNGKIYFDNLELHCNLNEVFATAEECQAYIDSLGKK